MRRWWRDWFPVLVLGADLAALIVWVVSHLSVAAGFAVGATVGFAAGLKW